MSKFPKDVKISIEEERYWEGLGRQERDFHQVVGELIDNSISVYRHLVKIQKETYFHSK